MFDKNRNDKARRIGSRIAELRKIQGLTQAQLADKSGLLQSQISRIEHGKYNITYETLTTLAKALNCSVELI
jgi:transcriptional regulator with XRE-family HTH domain